MTLVELLVAATMSVVIVGATASMLISAVRNQPNLSEQSQNVSAARWVLERMTREVRSGLQVTEATPSRVTFIGFVRRSSCGGGTPLPSSAPSTETECEIAYDCSSGDRCLRTEREPNAGGGSSALLIDGLASGNVFQYEPAGAAEKTYVGATLRLPNPDGPGLLTISDGATLRTPTLLSSG